MTGAPEPAPQTGTHSEPAQWAGGTDHGWSRLREDRVHFYDNRVQGAVDFIAATGVVGLLSEKLAKPTGRPRLCTVEGLLVGMTLCRHRYGGIYFNQVTDILHHRIGAAWRRRFKLKDRDDDFLGFDAGYSVIRRLFHDLMALMDPSPLPKNHRLPKHDIPSYYKAADPEVLAGRKALLVQVSNAIVEASLAVVRRELDDIWPGAHGVDATPVASFARGRKTLDDHTSTDPDAAWYVREGDHRDPDLPDAPNTGKKRRRHKAKLLYGYDLTLAVAHNPHHQPKPQPAGYGDPTELPALIMGFAVDKPGHSPGGNGIAVLRDIRQRGYKAGDVAADNLYNSCDPDHWQLPLLELGYRPTYSYRENQLGIQAQAYGALQIEGTWYCPPNAPTTHRRQQRREARRHRPLRH